MGLMMISIGICAALWEDKLRRTPNILKRGYFLNQYQTVFNQVTHPRPGAAAAAAVSRIDRSSLRSKLLSVGLRSSGWNSFHCRSLYSTDVSCHCTELPGAYPRSTELYGRYQYPAPIHQWSKWGPFDSDWNNRSISRVNRRLTQTCVLACVSSYFSM